MRMKYARNFINKDIENLKQLFGGEIIYNTLAEDDFSVYKPLNHMRIFINKLIRINQDAVRIYGNDGSRDPELNNGLIEKLKRDYAAIKEDINNLNKLAKEGKTEGKQAYMDCLNYINNSSILKDIDEDLKDLVPPQNAPAPDVVHKYINTLSGGISVSNPPSDPGIGEHMSYYPSPTIIPEAIQSTGKIDEIAEFCLLNDKLLTPVEKSYLNARIKNLVYIGKLTESRKNQPKNITRIVHSGKSILMPDLKNARKQDTNNGCWSCSYELLLQSRGIFIDQKKIRSYRPDVSSKETVDFGSKIMEGMVKDKVNSPYEFPDLLMDMVPNTAMHNAILTWYAYGDKKATAEMKKKFGEIVNNALRVHSSPVSVSNGSHFLTIVGINENGSYKVRNSMDTDPATYTDMSFEKFFITAQRGGMASLQLTWLSDIRLEKDGSCKDFNNSEFSRIEYKNKEVQPSGNQKDVNDDTAVRGRNFANGGELVNGLDYNEAVYVPRILQENVPVVNLTENINPNKAVNKAEFKGFKNINEASRSEDGFLSDEDDDFAFFEKDDQSEIDYQTEKKKISSDVKKSAAVNDLTEEEKLAIFSDRLNTEADYKKHLEGIFGNFPEYHNQIPEPYSAPRPVFTPITGFKKFTAVLQYLVSFGRIDKFAENQKNYDNAVASYDTDKLIHESRRDVMVQDNYKFVSMFKEVELNGLDAVNMDEINVQKAVDNSQLKENLPGISFASIKDSIYQRASEEILEAGEIGDTEKIITNISEILYVNSLENDLDDITEPVALEMLGKRETDMALKKFKPVVSELVFDTKLKDFYDILLSDDIPSKLIGRYSKEFVTKANMNKESKSIENKEINFVNGKEKLINTYSEKTENKEATLPNLI